MRNISELMLMTVILGCVPLCAAETKSKAESEHDMSWQDSDTGQFVFFAVLEGLYKDGVPNEVVDLVINPPRQMDVKVKHCFVFQCEICHAAYEAFATYRQRKPFLNSGGRDTFGKGVSDAIVSGLKSDTAFTRVRSLGAMIRPWILDRVKNSNLSKEKQQELVEKLLKFKEDARGKLGDLRLHDPLYKGWMFYGGCQACEAAEEIEKFSRQ